MKSINLILILLSLLGNEAIYSQCEDKNKIILRPSATSIETTVNASCQYIVPDMRSNWRTKSTGGYSLVGDLVQLPTPGTRVYAPDICRDFSVVITGTFAKGRSNCVLTVPDKYSVTEIGRAHV